MNTETYTLCQGALVPWRKIKQGSGCLEEEAMILNGGPGKASLRRTLEQRSDGGIEGAMQAPGGGLQAEGTLTRW